VRAVLVVAALPWRARVALADAGLADDGAFALCYAIAVFLGCAWAEWRVAADAGGAGAAPERVRCRARWGARCAAARNALFPRAAAGEEAEKPGAE
jgi:hypothetical protein